MPKSLRDLVLSKVSTETWVHTERSLECEKTNSRTMDKLSPRLLVVTLKCGHQAHDNTNRIESVSLKLFTDRINRKPIIRSIFTQEQLLIDFRVTLLNILWKTRINVKPTIPHELQERKGLYNLNKVPCLYSIMNRR